MHSSRPMLSVVAFLSVIYVGSAQGHHSIAPFDLERTISLSATVVEFEWANPHVYIQLQSRGQDGSTTEWMIEAGPPNLMARSGWSAKSLTPGESITAAVHPMRDGERNIALGESVVKDDGTFLPIRETAVPSELNSSVTAVATTTDSIFGRWIAIWDAKLAGRFLQPSNGWSVTEAGREAVEAYDVSASPSQDCNFEKPPFAMIWPSVREIVSEDNLVRIRFELTPDRVIYLNEADHDGAQFTPDGHSIGRFEGTTLVVDTDHFEEHRRGLAQGLPSSRQKHLVERFELDSSGTELLYRFRAEDPVYLAEPITGTIRFAHSPELNLESIECDPEIARRYLDYE